MNILTGRSDGRRPAADSNDYDQLMPGRFSDDEDASSEETDNYAFMRAAAQGQHAMMQHGVGNPYSQSQTYSNVAMLRNNVASTRMYKNDLLEQLGGGSGSWMPESSKAVHNPYLNTFEDVAGNTGSSLLSLTKRFVTSSETLQKRMESHSRQKVTTRAPDIWKSTEVIPVRRKITAQAPTPAPTNLQRCQMCHEYVSNRGHVCNSSGTKKDHRDLLSTLQPPIASTPTPPQVSAPVGEGLESYKHYIETTMQSLKSPSARMSSQMPSTPIEAVRAPNLQGDSENISKLNQIWIRPSKAEDKKKLTFKIKEHKEGIHTHQLTKN